MDSVCIVRNEKDAKLVFEPIRREILRLLAKENLAECDLATRLGLSPPTVGHHLKGLEKAGFVRVARNVAEAHGILQKFYESNAQVYIADSTKLPPHVKRRLQAGRIERTRGILAALSINNGGSYKPSSPMVERMTESLEPFLLEAAEKRQGPRNGDDPELVINEIYTHALKTLLKSRPDMFPRVVYAVQR